MSDRATSFVWFTQESYENAQKGLKDWLYKKNPGLGLVSFYKLPFQHPRSTNLLYLCPNDWHNNYYYFSIRKNNNPYLEAVYLTAISRHFDPLPGTFYNSVKFKRELSISNEILSPNNSDQSTVVFPAKEKQMEEERPKIVSQINLSHSKGICIPSLLPERKLETTIECVDKRTVGTMTEGIDTTPVENTDLTDAQADDDSVIFLGSCCKATNTDAEDYSWKIKTYAMDCEMCSGLPRKEWLKDVDYRQIREEFRDKKIKHFNYVCAICVVNYWGDIIFNFILKPEKWNCILNTGESVHGITFEQMFKSPFNAVGLLPYIKNFLKDKIVIGHAIDNDLRVHSSPFV